MLVTPKFEPNSVAPDMSSWMPVIGSVAAPAALVEAGMSSVIGPLGETSWLPSAENCSEAIGAGAPALPPTVWPLAVAYTSKVSVPVFWK